MRDPMSWSVPLFRAFGIPVRLHIFFIIITLGFFLRIVSEKGNPIWWGDVFLFTILLLFGTILLHEFGHCFGARFVGGEAKEILIWPLGGLAMNEIPHTPRALFITTAAGPAVNVLICVICAVGLAVGGFLPNLNPLSDPYLSEMYSFHDGRTHTSEYGLRMYKTGTTESVPGPQDAFEKYLRDAGSLRYRLTYPPEFNAKVAEAYAPLGVERAQAPLWAVWLNRTFWLSWFLFLFNMIPAYPLDGGQLLQSAVWARTDYRRGVVVAAYTGFCVAILFLIVSIWQNEALFMGLALFMFYMASMKLYQLDTEDGPFGYDFSAGYTSLEKDEEPVRKPKKVGWFTRWRQARRARRLQREAEERARDEERMDQLLEKIARSGKDSLTDEERRFLERMSARKRNMS